MKKQRRDEKLMMAVALRFKKIREERSIPQETVYYDTGINIGKIEIGTTNLTLTTIGILYKYYNVMLEELFTGIKLS